MNRFFLTPFDFLQDTRLVREIVDELEKQYNKEAKKKNGVMSNHDLEKIFNKVTGKLEIAEENEIAIAESLYDTFAGSLLLEGNSDYFFGLMKIFLQSAEAKKD